MIVRRPHAYKFKRLHKDAPIPGLVVLDADGKYLGSVGLPRKDAVTEIVKLLTK